MFALYVFLYGLLYLVLMVLDPLGLESLRGCWINSQHKEVIPQLVLTHRRADTGKNSIFTHCCWDALVGSLPEVQTELSRSRGAQLEGIHSAF